MPQFEVGGDAVSPTHTVLTQDRAERNNFTCILSSAPFPTGASHGSIPTGRHQQGSPEKQATGIGFMFRSRAKKAENASGVGESKLSKHQYIVCDLTHAFMLPLRVKGRTLFFFSGVIEE